MPYLKIILFLSISFFEKGDKDKAPALAAKLCTCMNEATWKETSEGETTIKTMVFKNPKYLQGEKYGEWFNDMSKNEQEKIAVQVMKLIKQNCPAHYDDVLACKDLFEDMEPLFAALSNAIIQEKTEDTVSKFCSCSNEIAELTKKFQAASDSIKITMRDEMMTAYDKAIKCMGGEEALHKIDETMNYEQKRKFHTDVSTKIKKSCPEVAKALHMD